jgi:hypothetical protein
MMKISLLLLVISLLNACKSVHVFSDQQFDDFIRGKSLPEKTKLRWDGYFNNATLAAYSESMYAQQGSAVLHLTAEQAKEKTVYSPEIFFGNGVYVVQNNILKNDQLLEPYRSGEQYKTKLGWGVYEINNDTITLLWYKKFQNVNRLPRWDTKIVKYQGYILNDTTITDWKQVPPYPNLEEDQLDTTPQRLEFRYYPEKNLIDSTIFLSKRKH